MYKSLKDFAKFETEILKSKFIGFCAPIKNEEEAVKFLNELSSSYKDATHICYAYIADSIGNVIRFSDDGEPSGTAGLPILDCIKNKNLKCVVVAVVRYFGGIKLGAGGLVRAYSKTCARVIEDAKICIYEDALKICTSCNYQQFKLLERIITKIDAQIIDRKYEDDIKLIIIIKKEKFEEFQRGLSDLFNDEAKLEILENLYYSF